MVAGGVGLAPFHGLAVALRDRGVETTLFYGARSAGELFHLDAFRRLGVGLALATDDGSRGDHGLVTAPLERALRGLDPADTVRLYACGPTPMMRAVTDLAHAHGRRTEVSLEQVMGCGLGGCYSCVVPVRRNGGAAPLRPLVPRRTGVRRRDGGLGRTGRGMSVDLSVARDGLGTG